MWRITLRQKGKNCSEKFVHTVDVQPTSTMLDAPTPPNGGKWELTYSTYDSSSHLPPLGGVGAFDMMDSNQKIHECWLVCRMDTFKEGLENIPIGI